MKHKIITTKQGYAKRKKGSGVLNWSYLVQCYPDYAKHIIRIRTHSVKLLSLRNRLEVESGKSR